MTGEMRGPLVGDAYGRLMRAYHEDGTGVEIVERDDGYLNGGRSAAAYFGEPADWPKRVVAALEHARGRVLDIGCGAGQHALTLQERGHDVVGIDISERACAIASERGVTDVLNLGIENLDHFEANAFGTICLLGNNTGLLGNATRAPGILAEFERITEREGIIIADSRDPQATDEDAHLAYHEHNRTRGNLPGRLRIRVRYAQYATPWFEYLLVSRADLSDLLESTRLSITESFGGDGGDYAAVLTKPS